MTLLAAVADRHRPHLRAADLNRLLQRSLLAHQFDLNSEVDDSRPRLSFGRWRRLDSRGRRRHRRRHHRCEGCRGWCKNRFLCNSPRLGRWRRTRLSLPPVPPAECRSGHDEHHDQCKHRRTAPLLRLRTCELRRSSSSLRLRRASCGRRRCGASCRLDLCFVKTPLHFARIRNWNVNRRRGRFFAERLDGRLRLNLKCRHSATSPRIFRIGDANVGESEFILSFSFWLLAQ